MNRKDAVEKAREVIALARRVIRKAKAADGVCYFCSRKAAKGRRLCPRHSALDNERTARRKAQRIKEGKCAKCGKVDVTKTKECPKCLARARARYARKQARTVTV